MNYERELKKLVDDIIRASNEGELAPSSLEEKARKL